MVLALCLALATLQGSGAVPHLLGAKAALKQMPPADPEAQIVAKEQVFLSKLQSYIARSPSMAPREAAEKWLALIDAAYAVPRRSDPTYRFRSIGTLGTVMQALPRPQVWPEIDAILAKRPAERKVKVLQLLFARLRGDEPRIRSLCAELSKEPAAKAHNGYVRPGPQFDKVIRARLGADEDLPGRIADYERSVVAANPSDTEEMPDIAGLLGPEKATPILLRIYKEAKSRVQLYAPCTLALAKRVVLQNLASIERAPWELVDGPDDGELAIKLQARYGGASADREDGTLACAYLAEGDVRSAAGILKEVGDTSNFRWPRGDWSRDSVSLACRPEDAARIFAGACELQKLLPDKDLWELYVGAAKASGNAAIAAERISAVVHDLHASDKTKSALLAYLEDLHGCVGDVRGLASDYCEQVESTSSKEQRGYALDRMLEFAEAVGDKASAKWARARKLAEFGANAPRFAEEFLRLGRLREAEDAEIAWLHRLKAEGNAEYNGDRPGGDLCAIYFAANRPRDVVKVLRDFPYWSCRDLGELLDWFGPDDLRRSGMSPMEPVTAVGYSAAWAFAKIGDIPLAVQTLERLVFTSKTNDAAYEMLNRLGGKELPAFYDLLHRSDPFEPRPLMWKADLLRRAGRLKDAERCARQAIALGPGDSEMAGTDRFRVYGILGAILKAKGETQGAAACIRAVRAGGLVDHAERLARIGLTFQSIACYRKAVEDAPNDCYIEKRLADLLSAAGRSREAATHAGRAYRLFAKRCGPDMDAGILNYVDLVGFEDVPNAAELLSQIGASDASSAYARALLELRLGAPRDAMEDLWKAVQFAPRFVVAWEELLRLGNAGFLSREDTEKVALALLNLKPTFKTHLQIRPERFRDLGALYIAAESALNKREKPSAIPLFRLHYSPTARRELGMIFTRRDPDLPVTPGSVVSMIPDLWEIMWAYDAAVGREY